MKISLAIFSFLLITFSNGLVAQTPDWLTGTWKGFGHQPNGLTQTEWSMTLTFKSAQTGDAKISVDYPSLKCGGTWTLQTVDINRCIFKENLTYGKKNCMDGGTCIVSQVDENYIHIAFYNDYSDASKITSSSLLRKEIK